MFGSDVDDEGHVTAESEKLRRDLRQTILSGVALTVPFFVTVLVIVWILDLVAGALSPLVGVLLVSGVADGMNDFLVGGLAVAIVFGLIFVVGFAAQHGPKTNLSERINLLIEDIPGVGPIYTGVERMSDVLLEGDTESFREVKLVEFPGEGSFAIAFLTADSPSPVEEVTGRDMETVFVPLAPNPVMGGHLLNVPEDRIYDVDLSVEEGMEAIMTTGITIDESAREDAA